MSTQKPDIPKKPKTFGFIQLMVISEPTDYPQNLKRWEFIQLMGISLFFTDFPPVKDHKIPGNSLLPVLSPENPRTV